jgi:predicted alpha/beta hydrolase
MRARLSVSVPHCDGVDVALSEWAGDGAAERRPTTRPGLGACRLCFYRRQCVCHVPPDASQPS